MMGLFSRRRQLIRDLARVTHIPLSMRHYADGTLTLGESLAHLPDDKLQEVSATAIGLARGIAWQAGRTKASSIGRLCLQQVVVPVEDVQESLLERFVQDLAPGADQLLFRDAPDLAHDTGVTLDQKFGEPEREALQTEKGDADIVVDAVPTSGSAGGTLVFGHLSLPPQIDEERLFDHLSRHPHFLFRIVHPDGSITLFLSTKGAA